MTGMRMKRWAALLLMLSLILPVWAKAGVELGGEISGTVRVMLSSMASKNAVDVEIDGSYSIGGDEEKALARGTKITVRSAGGSLQLTAGGQTQAMGKSFKLRRHETKGENGVRIRQARYPDSLYPGDVEFIASGNAVKVIVHVFMEDYMQGVLPYEMDNSFPLEALKAQAVAARTYALKKMGAHAAQYDVVDTTSDQVYNGTPPGNARCRQAVEETRGIVGMVNGAYMASYYTASNGGQTESAKNAWGSSGQGYLAVKDDPYDLRNAASIAKSVDLYKDGTTSVPGLTELLRMEAAVRVQHKDVQLEGITSVSLHSPKYDAPSRVYGKVDVGLLLAEYGEVTVTLDYFTQMESLCGLSINVLKNETLTVEETEDGFKLTSRRYGHGVGMSQRGAQQMAAEGHSYEDILEFYYPGLVRKQYPMTRTILPPLTGRPPKDDVPSADAKTAVIVLSNPLDSLNLRREQSASSPVVDKLAHGTQVILLEHLGEWSRVQHGTLTGFVKTEYLNIEGEAPVQPAAPTLNKMVVKLSDESQTLNLRAAPTASAKVLAKLNHGQELTVLKRLEGWTHVRCGSVDGYVMNDYLTEEGVHEPDEPNPPHAGQKTAIVQLDNAEGRLNIRETPSLSAKVLARAASGEEVEVLYWGEEWCEVKLGAVQGFCATAHLRFDGEEASARLTGIVLPTEGTELKAAPEEEAGILLELPQGTLLTVEQEENGGMLPAALGSVEGYLDSESVYVMEEPSALSPTPAPTATPAPTETPVPLLDTAREMTVTAETGLKLRTASERSSGVLATMPHGARVTAYGEPVNGFQQVQYQGLTGFASARYLEGEAPLFEEAWKPEPTNVPEPSRPIKGRPAKASALGGLNLREAPDADAKPIGSIGYGESVLVIGEAVNGFYPVHAGALNGYASADYLHMDGEGAEDAAGNGPLYRVVVESPNGLNLRAEPNDGGEVVYVLPFGMVLHVTGEAIDGFLPVRWGSYMGYVSETFVSPLDAE